MLIAEHFPSFIYLELIVSLIKRMWVNEQKVVVAVVILKTIDKSLLQTVFKLSFIFWPMTVSKTQGE